MNSRFAWVALAAALAIALAGCGGDGDGPSADAGAAGDDAPATEVLPADADGADGLDADGDVGSENDGDGATDSDGVTDGEDAGDAGDELDPLEEDSALDAALMTIDDVPAGWDEIDPQTGGAGICDFRLAEGADSTARAAFSSPAGAPAVEQLVMRFGAGAGKDSFTEWVDAVAGCDEVTAVDRTFAVSPYGAEQRGDESAGVKLVSDDVTSYTVLIRRGDDLSSVSWAALGEAGSEDVETFASVAAERLQDAS